MKRSFLGISVCLGLVTFNCVAKAETIEEFLKRLTLGEASKQDIHKNFRAIVFIGDQLVELDRSKYFQLQEEHKALGAKATVNDLTILSKTETAVIEGKGTLISIVSKVAQTSKVGGSTIKSQSINHDVIVRLPDGQLIMLFSAARQ